MEKIEHLDLWEYQIDYYGQDCDGGHSSRTEFLAVERPDEVVYNKAELFGEGGPSSVQLVQGSDGSNGVAHVGTPHEEGYSSYEITWRRVTSVQVLGEFLEAYEVDGPRLTTEFMYTDLYKARIGHVVKEKFPEAITAVFKPSEQRGELWRMLEVRGFDERNCPATFWEGEDSPFDEGTLKQLSRDLEGLYAYRKAGDIDPVHVRV